MSSVKRSFYSSMRSRKMGAIIQSYLVLFLRLNPVPHRQQLGSEICWIDSLLSPVLVVFLKYQLKHIFQRKGTRISPAAKSLSMVFSTIFSCLLTTSGAIVDVPACVVPARTWHQTEFLSIHEQSLTSSHNQISSHIFSTSNRDFNPAFNLSWHRRFASLCRACRMISDGILNIYADEISPAPITKSSFIFPSSVVISIPLTTSAGAVDVLACAGATKGH